MNYPNKNSLFPIENYDKLCFLKNIIRHPNIIVGDYTYYHDFEDVFNFEKNVKYLFEFTGDQLIIGKFCMIASDVKFIMNGANHITHAISSFPFDIFGGDWKKEMEERVYPFKGDTIIGNDVWIGYNATIMPGVHIGDGAIIATNTTVINDVPPYSIVGGNPGKIIKNRFSPQDIDTLCKIKWWDWEIEKITQNIKLITSLDIIKMQQI